MKIKRYGDRIHILRADDVPLVSTHIKLAKRLADDIYATLEEQEKETTETFGAGGYDPERHGGEG